MLRVFRLDLIDFFVEITYNILDKILLFWQVIIMAQTKNERYGNSSISMLKGEDRVRKRPAVIFGSDDLEGCKHAVFEILSYAIDEAREGHGDTIIVTRYEDLSVEVEDFGRGCPVDYNEKG